MPLPLLLIPLAIAGGSAVAQTVAKLRAHGRLNALRAELEQLESQHRAEMRLNYDRQTELCRQLGWPEPELPPVLQEQDQPEEVELLVPRWRRLLRRRTYTLADGSPHSRFGIIGRHAASFSAGAVWRTSSAPIMNVLRPIGARLLTFAPRLASFGGGGGSIAASTATSTGLRFAVGAFTVFGIILGPALAAWSIIGEIRKVKKAQRELESTRIQRQTELTPYAARTRRLQRRLADATPPINSAQSTDLKEPDPETVETRLDHVVHRSPAEPTHRGDLSRPAPLSCSTQPASDS